MATFHLLDLDGLPIFQQLQLEEALLRADDNNWCLINKRSDEAIVLGISSKFEEHVNIAKLKAQPVPVIRRFSGGGSVFIDASTHFYTLIGNKHILDVPCTPQDLLGWTERLYAPAFTTLDFALKENDYAIGLHKFGGNAQYLCKDRWLHHSSLLWNYQAHKMEYLCMPPKMPTYRKQREHAAFLCMLSAHFSCEVYFKQKMLAALAQRHQLVATPLEKAWPILQREHRRATIVLPHPE